MINRQHPIQIKFYDHSLLFYQLLKKTGHCGEVNFWQLGTRFSCCCGCGEVAIVERFKKSQSLDCSLGQKKWPLWRGGCLGSKAVL